MKTYIFKTNKGNIRVSGVDYAEACIKLDGMYAPIKITGAYMVIYEAPKTN